MGCRDLSGSAGAGGVVEALDCPSALLPGSVVEGCGTFSRGVCPCPEPSARNITIRQHTNRAAFGHLTGTVLQSTLPGGHDEGLSSKTV